MDFQETKRLSALERFRLSRQRLLKRKLDPDVEGEKSLIQEYLSSSEDPSPVRFKVNIRQFNNVPIQVRLKEQKLEEPRKEQKLEEPTKEQNLEKPTKEQKLEESVKHVEKPDSNVEQNEIQTLNIDDDSESMDDEASATIFWIPEFHLREEDKRLIEDDELNDTVIEATQTILKQQYQVDGLQSPLLCQSSNGFSAAKGRAVQMHYDEEEKHWVTSSSTRGRVEIANSLHSYVRPVSKSIMKQLKQIYNSYIEDERLTVYLLPVQQQKNGIDCGLHAIANAVEFLHEGGDPTARYDVPQMRKHLVQCLEARTLTPFPKRKLVPVASRRREVIVKKFKIKGDQLP